ncbi:hypothetical protein [Umezawaea tangerina]|uniref:Secreted protein n=1 Tax=Umezawaea tangerina TaxID=84725 RepID=A0A2T0T6N1_9PSEU|nr:hypothetical protein [Umezawaea tangerina]PRY41318.1 hypothetical protein CLV43_10576 [Umezawaea tangerina]
MDFLAPVATFACVPVSLAVFAWFAVRARRRGSGHSLMAPFEDIWDPSAHRTHIEIQVQENRTTRAPSPGDPPPP